MRTAPIVALFLLIAVATPHAAAAAEARVELEVAMERGAPVTAPQEWTKILSGVGFDGIRIRSQRPDDRAGVENVGTQQRPSYRVTGLLTAGDALELPGGRFTRRDTGRMKQYLARLRADGTEGVTARRTAFGLTPTQLESVVRDLTRPIDFTTRGKRPADILEQIGRRAELPLAITPEAARALQTAEPAGDEVEGITAGTGLAALLRPLGLVVRPRKSRGGGLSHTIEVATPESEGWPVGWPPQKEERELLPKMLEFLNVEIEEIPLDETLQVLAERLQAPLLMDHNRMALHDVVPAKIEVTLPPGRSYYKRILKRVLFQGKLTYELRVDEAGQPLLWVTTIKK